MSRPAAMWLGLVLPLGLIAVILLADTLEGPKTAYVGVLAVVPMLAAVFASPAVTAVVGVVTWLAAFGFGQVASDGNVGAQQVRLVIIALFVLIAVAAATLRTRRDSALVAALTEAATAERMRYQAETDHLTSLPNRRGLTNRLAGQVTGQLRTVALIDCDELKAVNDELGHLAGDEYLQAIAGRLAGSLSKDDLIARWGGDEFIVVQNLTIEQAMPTLERMHAAVNSSAVSLEGTMRVASISMGVTLWAPTMTLDEALVHADGALYEAKARGRNQIVTAS